MNNTSNRQLNNRNNRRRIPRSPQLAPPKINSDFRITHKYRFTKTTPANDTFRVSDLGTILMSAAGATVGYALADAYRIVKLELWLANPSAQTPSTVTLQWLNSDGSFGGPGNAYSDTAMGGTNVAHIKASPPENSIQSAWHPTSAGSDPPLFQINSAANAVMDITLEFTLNMFGPATPLATSGAGMTAGLVYTRAVQGWRPLGARDAGN